MTKLLTAAQMRSIEQAAIASGQVTGLALMERAGCGVVEAIFEEWPALSEGAHRAVVLCGPGNNGGDGFVVARLLKQKGWAVEVFLYGDPAKLPQDAKTNFETCKETADVHQLGFPVLSEDDAKRIEAAVYGSSDTQLFVDALFGTGLTRPIDGLQAFLQMHKYRTTSGDNGPVRTISVDLPSGICADSGRILCGDHTSDVLEMAIQADLTVTFHALKLCHALSDAPDFCGKVVVKSIGLDKRADFEADVKSSLAQPKDRVRGNDIQRSAGALNDARNGVNQIEPLHQDFVHLVEAPSPAVIGKSNQSHKFSHGHALVMTGGPGNTGAARLAARGALRVGAGLVTLGVPPAAQQEVASQVTALMLKWIADASALEDVLKDNRITALCIGPALGLQAEKASFIETVLARRCPTVLDADALTLISREQLLLAALHADCVLTPHLGEFKRLFPDLAARLVGQATSGPAYSKADAVRAAAERAGCVVVLKGPDTVIAAPDGRCAINAAFFARAAPWLATAGSGDVLAGFITGLLARGFAPLHACEAGVWFHVACARFFGPGLIAEDLPDMLPKVFSTLEG